MQRILSSFALLPLVPGILSPGFCPDGQCFNCMYCNGDCLDDCSCFSDINTCCCKAPPGHYARGYEAVPCPGGTYQPGVGQISCIPCNTSEGALFDVTYRGAVDLFDCEEARCENQARCGNDAACQAGRCATAVYVQAAMMTHPENITFCSSPPMNIGDRSCSWSPRESGAIGGRTPTALLQVIAVLIALTFVKPR
eukprot:TRINITY_DN43478_c0_g1_i1.p1 TRINITY_DN43478_c0_g1~~TRINITY_DN43478_c0_g1_i1.p1  ORF type:complete len:216 (-),score=27.40 TRINITY_DN43478_c0_g1_i1:12-599(-)